MWKKRSFTSSGKLYDMKAFGTYSLQFASVGIQYPLFHLLMLANLAIGGIDKVKYYVCQMDRLLDSGLRNILVKWRSADCPYNKLLLASDRKIYSRTIDSSRKTEGLDEEDLQDEEDEGKCLLLFTSPFPD